jgi:hypothetical protein
VLGRGLAQALLGLADPVLDRVLVQHQLLGGGLVAAAALQEHQQGVPQPGVLLVVGGQAAQRGQHPGAQQLGRAQHHRHRRDLAERHQPGRGWARGQGDRLRGQGLLVGQAETGDAPGRVAKSEVQVAVHVGGGRSGGVEPVPDPQRQPGPGAGLVARQEQQLAGAGDLLGDVADHLLEPGDVVHGGRRLARPAHEAHVVLAQAVAQGGLGRADADPLPRQQGPDPGGPRGTALAQPVFPFAGVGGDDLFGGLVDVAGHDPGHAQRGRSDQLGFAGLPGQLLEEPFGEARVPEPVGPDQCGQ